MRQVIAESGAIRARRFVVRLLGGFAALALVLAGVGLYGVMAYFVVERRREIAVRVALGATRASFVEQVLGEAVRLLADRPGHRGDRGPPGGADGPPLSPRAPRELSPPPPGRPRGKETVSPQREPTPKRVR